MNNTKLKKFLEVRQNSMSAREFFDLILEMLEKDIPSETRQILESHLMIYSHIDEDRTARYLEKFLFGLDPSRMKFAILELISLAKTSNSVADKILEKFMDDKTANSLGEKRTEGLTKVSELEQDLETRRKNMTENEFFILVMSMLEQEGDLGVEKRELLNNYLIAYSSVDQNRVARYLEKYLSDPDALRREFAARDLALLANDPNSLAYKILSSYLGEEPVKEKKTRIMAERLMKLFPLHKGKEDQVE